ncbi:MAG: type II toxin-antitoxin system VapC family toxin [Acidimicrobiales bacterium]
MRLLLDTHALIWMATDAGRLSERAGAAISDPGHDVYLSSASGWEIAIKRSRGRLRFPDVDRHMINTLRLTELPVTLRHASEIGTLPDHHRDPFDRMLIAQARSDGLTIVSRDHTFAAYDVPVYW